MTLPNPQRHVVPTAVLTKSKLVPLTTARPVTTAIPQPHVTRPRPAKTVVTKLHSPPRRDINRRLFSKPSNFPLKVTIVKTPKVNVVTIVQGNWGTCPICLNLKKYLSDFEEINGGYVAFGGNPKGGKITGKGKIRTGKLDFDDVYFFKELKFNLFSVSQIVPRENNMYNVDLKNIVLSGDLTCLFAKATLEESNLWHKRLGHINFKTMNKLVKGNLVRGLPSKVFENNHTCVACKNGKQHRASCKTKHVSSVSQPLQRTPSIGFMRPFGCPVTILNTLDPLGKFDGKADEGFLVRYSSTDDDAVFEGKKPEFEGKKPEFEGEKPESEVHVSPSSSAKTKKHDDKTEREAKGKTLEDITYSDDKEDVGAEADFTNLEINITVSPIPTTRVHKDHHEEGIDYEEVFALVARVETPLFEGMIVAHQADDVADEVVAELPSTSQVIPTPPSSPIAQPSSPTQQPQPSQPTHDAEISLDLLHAILETCTTLTRKVEALEQDKVAQALEIIKLKQMVKKLERKNKLKVSGMMHPIGGIIKLIDADKDVTLEEVKVNKNAEDDELEPVELKEVVKVVTTAKLMTEVVTASTTPITAATIAAAPNKEKGIMVQEPKPLKKKTQIEQDETYARELEAELNKNINWDDVIEQVQRKEKEDNVVLRYQALKRKPQTEAQAKKNMMIYLRNMARFKMDYFKGMSYDDIRPTFEKEDLEVLCQIVKERFASSKPKNFSDDFLLTTLTYMFEKPDVEAQMILLVERRYPLTRFTLDQMLNNVRLEVEEESEVSLELLRFVRQQQLKGFRLE
uniref:GAG-pre-integrase domain-containing protein n=1 Tax=Tanacetum cinerariifolium TaxID=118510 RepID=A0A699HNE6_TANCI|nr:hypothetical protein [Tanacetum cinerariifolium]